MVAFGDIADFRNGLNYNRQNFGRGLKVVSVADFGDRRVPDYSSLGEINPDGVATEEDLLTDGDLLFVRSNGNRALVGRVLFVEAPPIEVGFSGFCIRARVHRAIANPKYYSYFFRSKAARDALSSGGTGASIQSISQGALKSVFVPLPSIKSQLQTVAVLQPYDDLIEKNQRRIKLLEEAARRLYREWFVALRFPGHERVKVVDDVPQGWSQGNALGFVKVLSGGTPKTDVDNYWNGGIPFFTPKDCPNEFLVTSTEKTLTDTGLTNCNSRLFPKETIFITARGTVGKLALSQRPMAMNQSCYAVVAATPFNNLFLFLALLDGVAHFKQVASGGVFDAIVIDTFKLIPFLLPPAALTEQFGDRVRPVFDQMEVLTIASERLKQARDALLPRLMSGALAV